MTFSELQQAVDAASAGSTVYVTSDLVYDAPLVVSKQLTLASAEGESFTISRDADYASGLFLATDASTDLTLRDITISGNKAAGKIAQFMTVYNGGVVTLESGATICDAYATSAGAIDVSASTLNMREGATIRGIENDAYGVAVRIVGNGSFAMTGGLITGCAGHNYGYGVVYVYGGTFAPTGGSVINNTADSGSGGVECCTGSFNFSGSFVCTNNVGTRAGDVIKTDSCALRLAGDYTGYMTLNLGTAAEGDSPTGIWTSDWNVPRAGGANIVAANDPTLGLSFNPLKDQWYPTWTKIGARLEGAGRVMNTFSFDEAFKASQAGDTLVMLKDDGFTWTRTLDHDLTICGATGNEVIRQFYDSVGFISVSSGNKLTLRDIAIDGNGYKNAYDGYQPGFLVADANAVIELGSGAVLRNAICASMGGAVKIGGGEGSKLIMLDGAVISNCTATSSAVWGSAIVVGGSARFEMRGGLITGCSDGPNTYTPPEGYGGIIYLYNGDMDMSGGVITGNTSANSGASIVGYVSGYLYITGDARIEGNTGPYPGVWLPSSCRIRPYGDFRGVCDVSFAGNTVGSYAYTQFTTASGTGAWCFHRKGNDVSQELVGFADKDGYVYWDVPIGSVGGVQVAREGDLAYIVPKSLDLDAGSKDRARLPIVFSGAATNLSGVVTLSYDPIALGMSGDLPLTLLAAGAGEKLMGLWNLLLPTGAAEAGQTFEVTDTEYKLVGGQPPAPSKQGLIIMYK